LFAFFSPECIDPEEAECPQFAPPNRRPGNDITAIGAVANRVRDLMTLFGGTRRLYGYGGSQGALDFYGPYSHHPAIQAFDGLVLRSGAGTTDFYRSQIHYCAQPEPRRYPVTGLTASDVGLCNETVDFSMGIRTCDVATSDAIFERYDAGDTAGAWSLIGNYDPFAQSGPVGNCWRDLRSSGDLQLPLIYLQGTMDRGVSPHDGIYFHNEIIQAGKAQLARFYYIKLGNHPLNQRTPTRLVSKAIFVQAFAYLVDWVENGNEPGPL